MLIVHQTEGQYYAQTYGYVVNILNTWMEGGGWGGEMNMTKFQKLQRWNLEML